MVARVKEETVMDSKVHMVARDKVGVVVAAAMEDGVKVKNDWIKVPDRDYICIFKVYTYVTSSLT